MTRARVAVVGGGVIGCAVAWELARRGWSVTLFERDVPGRAASRAAGGMLSPLAESDAPGPFLELGLASLDRFPALVEGLRRATGVNPGYLESGKLRVATTEAGVAALERDHAWQRSLGHAVEWLDAAGARRLEPALAGGIRAALLVERDYQVDSPVFARALWQAAALAGVEVVRGAPVSALATGPAPAAARAAAAVTGIILATGEVVAATHVVLAAGSWSGLVAGLPRRLPVFPVPGQIVELTTVPPVFRRVIETERCYLIPRADGRLLVGATAEAPRFAARPTAAGVRGLLDAALEAAPALADAPLTDAWGGLRPATPDHLPVLGEDPEVAGLFYATGHYRNGILLAPITAEVIADLVDGRAPAISLEPFRPDRFGDDPAADAGPAAP